MALWPFFLFGVDDMQSREIRSFTGIRALALWGVILYHLYPHIIRGGYLGVVIFFVLSGYLLMVQHLTSTKNDPLQKFKKQYIKLTPPLLLVVTVTLVFAALFFRDDFHDVLYSGAAAILGVNNWQQIFRGLSYFDLHGKFLPFTHFWALSAQIQFYLIWAILRKCFCNHREKFALSLAVTGILSLFLMTGMKPFMDDATRIYYGTDTRFFSFTIGALAGMIGCQGSFNKSQKRKSNLVSLLIALMLLCFLLFKEGSFLYYGGMLFFTLAMSLLLLITARDDNRAAKMLDNPLLRYFGTRSYELYLWQYPVMLVFRQLFSHSEFSYHTVVLLQMPVLFALGEGTYRLFRSQSKKKTVRLSLAVFLLVGILGGIIIPTPKENEMERARLEAIAAQKREAERKKIEAENAELSEPIREINEKWPELALSARDLKTLETKKGLMIGDSITEMTAVTIENLLPNFKIDGKKNRQMVQAKDILTSYDLSSLGADAPIVIQLGTNSDFKQKVLNQLLDACGDHPVYLMTTVIPDPWEASVNDKFKEEAKTRDNVHIIDWYKIAKEHEDLFVKDHTHPKGLGMDLFAQTIAKHMLSQKKEGKKQAPKSKKPHGFKALFQRKSDKSTPDNEQS